MTLPLGPSVCSLNGEENNPGECHYLSVTTGATRDEKHVISSQRSIRPPTSPRHHPHLSAMAFVNRELTSCVRQQSDASIHAVKA